MRLWFTNKHSMFEPEKALYYLIGKQMYLNDYLACMGNITIQKVFELLNIPIPEELRPYSLWGWDKQQGSEYIQLLRPRQVRKISKKTTVYRIGINLDLSQMYLFGDGPYNIDEMIKQAREV